MPHEVAPKTSANIGLNVEDAVELGAAALFIGYGLYNLVLKITLKNQWKKPVKIMQ